MVKAKAFEFIKQKGKYAADGVEMAFQGDEDSNVQNLENALLVIRDDFETPDEKDMKDFYEFMNSLHMLDFQSFTELYKPVDVEITNEQLSVIRERNEW